MLQKQIPYVAKALVSEILYDFVDKKEVAINIKPKEVIGNVIFYNIYAQMKDYIAGLLVKLGFPDLLTNKYVCEFMLYTTYQIVLQMLVRGSGIEVKGTGETAPLKKEAFKFDKLVIRSIIHVASGYIVDLILPELL